MTFEAGREVEPTTLFVQAGAATVALPKGVSAKLLAVQERADSLHRLIPLSQERQELGTAVMQETQRLNRLVAHVSDGGFHLHENDPRVVEQRRRVAELTSARDRLTARYERASQAWQPARRLVANVEAWLKGLPGGTVLQDFEGSAPKLNGKETLLEAIERLRHRGRELAADLHRIASAPYPSTRAKAKMRQEIEALAQRGAPSMSLLVEHDRSIGWPQQSMQARTYNSAMPGFAAVETVDTLALTCWLHRDALIAKLDALIAEEADDKAALSHEGREQRAALLSGDLLDIERQEAALVWRGLDEGMPVEHRVDANPQAILQCHLVTVPAVEQPVGWTPGMSWDLRR